MYIKPPYIARMVKLLFLGILEFWDRIQEFY